MSNLPSPADRLLGGAAFLPRVDRLDGRAIDDALGSATLFDEGVRLRGAVVEGAYAAKDPPLVKRLSTEGVPYLMDLHSLRFVGEGYLDVRQVAELPYAPSQPIDPGSFSETEASTLATGGMSFTQSAAAAVYTTPTLPMRDKDLEASISANRQIIEAVCSANGVGDLERRPVVALIAPGRKALAQPELVLDWLLDLPVDAVYMQPLNFNPVRDSPEKLASYITYLRAFREAQLRIMCGRVGAFGLLLQALVGISAFDSGLGTAEAFQLSTQLRKPSRSKKKRNGPAGDSRVYFEPIKTTLASKHAIPLIEAPGMRHRLTCSLGCCQFRGFEDLASRRRAHYLFTRIAEVDAIASRPETMRVDAVRSQLAAAREHARVARRVLFAAEDVAPPSFEHLDRWLGLLARGEQLRLTA
jgi:hypothetical protein